MNTSDDYETIVFENNYQKDIMNDSLNEVKLFIQRNKRILVGGMAIDFALRTIGKKLYPDNKFPDYDFVSPVFHSDAYNLGQKLAMKYDGVSVIGAFHVSTMRVRVNFQETADITYIPQNVYDNIPTLEYKGFVIVHPHYQMIDQHRALSLPYEGAPMETVMGRWKKDIKRYELLSSNFPIKLDNNMEEKKTDIEDEKDTISHIISSNILSGECIAAYASLLYWISRAKKDGKTFNIPDWMNSWEKKANHIKVELPNNINFSIYSDDYVNMIKKIPNDKTTYYNGLLDKIQRRIIVDGKDTTFEILDNKGDMRGAYLINSDDINNNIYVDNLQSVMCYLLTSGIFYKRKEAIKAYLVARKILFWASDQFAKTKDKKYMDYLPTTTTYGKYNVYEAHLINKDNFHIQFYNKQRTTFTPKNAYPAKGETVKSQLYQFDPTSEPLYQFDGLETTTFQPRIFEE